MVNYKSSALSGSFIDGSVSKGKVVCVWNGLTGQRTARVGGILTRFACIVYRSLSDPVINS